MVLLCFIVYFIICLQLQHGEEQRFILTNQIVPKKLYNFVFVFCLKEIERERKSIAFCVRQNSHQYNALLLAPHNSFEWQGSGITAWLHRTHFYSYFWPIHTDIFYQFSISIQSFYYLQVAFKFKSLRYIFSSSTSLCMSVTD